jgi:hypothetical protein
VEGHSRAMVEVEHAISAVDSSILQVKEANLTSICSVAPVRGAAGYGFRVSSFVFHFSGFGFRIFWCRVSGFGFRVSNFLISGVGFRVSWYRVSGFGFRVFRV